MVLRDNDHIIFICKIVSSFSILPDFTNLINVTKISIQNCKIPIDETLYELTSQISKNIKRLRIFFNLKERRSSFNKYLFQGLSNLEDLEIHHIESVESSDIFEHLVNLKRLELFYVTIPEGIFDPMNQLQFLNIEQPSFLNLTAEHFKNQKNLVELILKCNKGSSLDALIFGNLPNLKNFTLNGKCLISWSENMFKNNQKLKSIELRDNKILIPHKLTLPANLKRGFFIDCNIQKLSKDLFKNSTIIEELDLSNNKLISLPKELFLNQIMLRELNLSRNQIKDLSDGLFDTTLNMEKLNLNFNKLKSLSRNLFAKLLKLEKLFLGHNQLTTIDDSFRNLELKEINLRNNKLSNTERLFENTFNLKKLYLNNNNINNFSIADYRYIPNLQLINLSRNKIQTFCYGHWMKYKQNLKIDLSYNNISEFKINDVFKQAHYEKFHLLLDINHNPIICDCNALELVQFTKMQIEPDNIYKNFDLNMDELTCQKPVYLFNRHVKSLSTSELTCYIEKDCPDGCRCQQRPVDNTLIFKCSVLQQFPTLSTYANLNLTSIELTYYLTNNNLFTSGLYATGILYCFM